MACQIWIPWKPGEKFSFTFMGTGFWPQRSSTQTFCYDAFWSLVRIRWHLSVLKRNHSMLGYICMATAHRYHSLSYRNKNWGSKTTPVVSSLLQLLSQGQRCHLQTAAPTFLHISKCLGSINCRISEGTVAVVVCSNLPEELEIKKDAPLGWAWYKM